MKHPMFFCEETKSLNDIMINDNLSFVQLNIRSLNSNFEHFKNLLSDCGHCFNIICLSKT